MAATKADSMVASMAVKSAPLLVAPMAASMAVWKVV